MNTLHDRANAPTLEELQRGFCVALEGGPDLVPQSWFAGPQDRALLGFLVHATTIGHARFEAVCDLYPEVRALLGPERFDPIALEHAESEAARSCPLSEIGIGFTDRLRRVGVDATAIESARAADARHACLLAPEAVALELPDIAALDEETLLTLEVRCHPAVAVVRREGDADGPATVTLVSRPGAELRHVVLGVEASAMLDYLLRRGSCSVGELLGAVLEGEADTASVGEDDNQGALDAILTLLGAGALTQESTP